MSINPKFILGKVHIGEAWNVVREEEESSWQGVQGEDGQSGAKAGHGDHVGKH